MEKKPSNESPKIIRLAIFGVERVAETQVFFSLEKIIMGINEKFKKKMTTR